MNQQDQTNARHSRLLAVVPVVLHLLVAVPLAWILNVWSDEASTLYTTAQGVGEASVRVFNDERQAPLYFLIMSLWREVAPSVFAARMFSVACTVGAIVVFRRIVRDLLSPRGACLATFFFALHPFLIWSALEIRVYAMVVLLTCGLIALFREGFLNDDGRLRLLYIPLAVVAIYTNYYLGFILVANFAALLVLRPRRAPAYLASMAVVAALIAPLAWIVAGQMARVGTDVRTPGTLADGVRMIFGSVCNFLLPTELFPAEEPTAISVVRVWIVRLGLVALAGLGLWKRKDVTRESIAAGASAIVVAGFLLVAYFALGEIYVEIRHAAVLFPPLILFAALLMRDLATGLGRPGPLPTAVAAGLFAALFAYSVQALYPVFAKRGDWIRIADHIAAHEKPGQPIVVYTVFDALSLPNHYRGVNRILPGERFFDWGFEANVASPESARSEAEFAISQIPPDAVEIWLATGERCQATKVCEALENYIGANYTIVEDKAFYKERLRLLRRIEK